MWYRDDKPDNSRQFDYKGHQMKDNIRESEKCMETGRQQVFPDTGVMDALSLFDPSGATWHVGHHQVSTFLFSHVAFYLLFQVVEMQKEDHAQGCAEKGFQVWTLTKRHIGITAMMKQGSK